MHEGYAHGRMVRAAALWIASVGNPSSGKSPDAAPITADVLPLVEAHMARSYPDDLAAWSAADQVAKAFETQWERDLAQAVRDGSEIPPKPPEAARSAVPIPRGQRCRTRLRWRWRRSWKSCPKTSCMCGTNWLVGCSICNRVQRRN